MPSEHYGISRKQQARCKGCETGAEGNAPVFSRKVYGI
nr:MAG TPA: hypothetical protein [Caudoviricetes sp.]